MVNKFALHEKAYDKIATEAFDAIVGSIMLSAIPIDKSTRREYTDVLYESATGFIKECGGYSLLNKALENTSSEASHALTNVIRDVVHDTAMEVAKRVEASELPQIETSIPSALDKVLMTPEELNNFKAKAENISMEEIGNVIKKRTINVIKEERAMYEKEEKMKNDLQEALDASESMKGVSVENYATTTNKFTIGHDTFFSKLQTMAFENLIYKFPYSEDQVFNTINRIANECGTLINGYTGEQKTFNSALEEIKSYRSAVNEEIALTPDDRKSCMDDAMFAAMVVYCMLETLNKLNFIKIDKDKLKEFIKSGTRMDPDSCCKGDIDTTKAAVKGLISNSTKDLRRGVDKSVLLDRIDSLSEAKTALSDTDESGFFESQMEVFAEEHKLLDKAIATLEAAVSVQDKEPLNKYATNEIDIVRHRESQQDRINAANVMKCDRIGKLFSKFPQITDILMRIDPNQNFRNNIVIDVEGRNAANGVERQYTLTLAPDNSRPPVELVKCAAESSTICNDGKYVVTLTLTNSGEKILLN